MPFKRELNKITKKENMMKKFNICLIVLLVFLSVELFGVHNFTVNGQEELTIVLGDSLEFYFEYENVGNTATLEVIIEIETITIPLFSSGDMLFEDGGALDETGIDGIFMATMSNYFSGPESVSLLVIFTDEDISDEVIIHFQPLVSDFSISGKVEMEDPVFWWNLPVPLSLVYTLYNVDILELIALLEDFSLEELLLFLQQGRYIVAEITNLFGNYTSYIPDDIPDVSCIVGVFSALNLEDNLVAPGMQTIIVNGHVDDIDFLYLLPDGKFQGVVIDEYGLPIINALILVYDDPVNMKFNLTDSLGTFSIPLMNGTYDYVVAATGYQSYAGSVTINNGNVYQEIVLETILVDVDDNLTSDFVDFDFFAYPNPFSNGITFQFELKQKGQVKIEIYNVKGQLIETLCNEYIGAGVHSAKWNVNEKYEVSNGIYFFKIGYNNKTLISKIALIR